MCFLKGKLSNGQEIAIKRLSKSSGQGLIEFKNEAMLIVKLQHTSLVRLLGFCIDREEIILIILINPSNDLEFEKNANLKFYINTYYVPTILFVCSSDSASSNILAVPKSDIFGFNSLSNKMLLAFKSLCITFNLEY